MRTELNYVQPKLVFVRQPSDEPWLVMVVARLHYVQYVYYNLLHS